jgi:hypothetical protein
MLIFTIFTFFTIVNAQSCMPHYLECYNNYTLPAINNSTLFCNTYYKNYSKCIAQCDYSLEIRDWLISFCAVKKCNTTFCELNAPPAPLVNPNEQYKKQHDVILFISILVISSICTLIWCILYVQPCVITIYNSYCVKKEYINYDDVL